MSCRNSRRTLEPFPSFCYDRLVAWFQACEPTVPRNCYLGNDLASSLSLPLWPWLYVDALRCMYAEAQVHRSAWKIIDLAVDLASLLDSSSSYYVVHRPLRRSGNLLSGAENASSFSVARDRWPSQPSTILPPSQTRRVELPAVSTVPGFQVSSFWEKCSTFYPHCSHS